MNTFINAAFVTGLTLVAMTTAHAQGVAMSQLARGTFEVRLQPLPFEGADAQWKLGRMSIDKEIAGDLVATTKGSAGYVAIERVTGSLNGKKGSFVLQHNGLMNRGAPSLSVVVIPDSGTDELVGLEGEFKIVIEGGKHSYEFSYRLPAGEKQ
jgi:hypothetical protein